MLHPSQISPYMISHAKLSPHAIPEIHFQATPSKSTNQSKTYLAISLSLLLFPHETCECRVLAC